MFASRDFWSGCLLLVIGALITAGAARLGVGTLAGPKSGFLSFHLGLAILVLGGVIALKGAAARQDGPGMAASLRRAAALAPIVLAMALYAALLERIGFILASFLLLWGLLALSRREVRSVVPVLYAAGITAASYLLFETALKSGLPAWPT